MIDGTGAGATAQSQLVVRKGWSRGSGGFQIYGGGVVVVLVLGFVVLAALMLQLLTKTNQPHALTLASCGMAFSGLIMAIGLWQTSGLPSDVGGTQALKVASALALLAAFAQLRLVFLSTELITDGLFGPELDRVVWAQMKRWSLAAGVAHTVAIALAIGSFRQVGRSIRQWALAEGATGLFAMFIICALVLHLSLTLGWRGPTGLGVVVWFASLFLLIVFWRLASLSFGFARALQRRATFEAQDLPEGVAWAVTPAGEGLRAMLQSSDVEAFLRAYRKERLGAERPGWLWFEDVALVYEPAKPADANEQADAVSSALEEARRLEPAATLASLRVRTESGSAEDTPARWAAVAPYRGRRIALPLSLP